MDILQPLFVKRSGFTFVAVYLTKQAGLYEVAFFDVNPEDFPPHVEQEPTVTTTEDFEGPLTERNIDQLIVQALGALRPHEPWLPADVFPWQAAALIGQRLQNGACVLDVRYPEHPGDRHFYIVLADKGHGHHPYVVWTGRADGSCTQGYYFGAYTDGVEGLETKHARLPKAP